MTLCVLWSFWAHANPDTRECAYWLKRLDDVAAIEHAILYAVPAIMKSENVYSAMDLELDLRERLTRLRKQIDKENAE